MEKLLRIFLTKSPHGYAAIPCTAELSQFSGKTILLALYISEDKQGLFENSTFQDILNRFGEEFENALMCAKQDNKYTLMEDTSCSPLSYGDFIGKGRRFFRQSFPNRSSPHQKALLKKIINEGWDMGKNNVDIAKDFDVNYKTFGGVLVEWGLKSNRTDHNNILRKRLQKK